MDTGSYGDKVCLLCERPAYPTDYYPPGFRLDTDKRMVVPLCQYHKATYMAHGLKQLDKMYNEGKLQET